MKYIGITGHRGSGKTTIAYLLGNTLEMLKFKYTKEQIKSYFDEWCETIKLDNNAIYDCNLKHVYFDEFGEMPKAFTAQLLSIDMDLLDSEFMKDNMYVNMKDFKLYKYDPSNTIMTNKELLEHATSTKRWKDVYVTLRDFITYFSIDIMKTYFGNNVWLKTRIVNDDKYGSPDDVFKLFSDTKTAEEIKYIKDKNGLIIRAVRPSNKKNNKGITDTEDCTADFVIITEGELTEMFDSIFEIANKIYTDEKISNNTV